MELKDRVRELRGKMSRAKFSEKYGIPQRTLEDWESGTRKPAEYVVDMLAKEIAREKTIPMAWVFREYRDARGYGEDEIFTDRWEAEDVARAHWNGLTEHDRRDYFVGEAWHYVGLFEMEWDEDLEEYAPTGDPIRVTWDAVK